MLIVWTSLILLRHLFYWSMVALNSSGLRTTGWNLSMIGSATYFSMIAFALEAIGLTMILMAALDSADRATSFRKLGTGSIFVLISLLVTVTSLLSDWINRSNAMSLPTLMSTLWRIVAAMAASSPSLLALLAWRESKSAMNCVTL